MIPQARVFDPLEILERYPAVYRSGSASLSQPARGFSGASVWKVVTPAGPCALRATAPDAVDRRRLAGLHRLLAHVRLCGLTQVGAPLASADGATFFECEGRIWQLEPWMPGAADFSIRPSELRLQNALVCLAEWHRAAARFVPQTGETPWFFTAREGHSAGLAERACAIARWNDDACQTVRRRLAETSWTEFAGPAREILENFLRAAPRVAAQLAVGRDARVPLQPCLRDVWHDHVLFTGDEVTGLIDAHAARSDSVATDLARLLGTLVGDDRRLWDVGLAAYQRIRPLAESELALIELFDQSAVLLGGMTWLDWHCLKGRVFDNRREVLARLHAIGTRLTALAAID